jgi:3-phytase
VTSVVTNDRSGRVTQHELRDADGDGRVEAVLRRSWDVGTETEGCVADDAHGHLYISEESAGIWKYGAEPTASTGGRVRVDRPVAGGGHLRPDVEGLTIVDTGGGHGYLIASSQAASNAANSYVVYNRTGSNAFIRSFKVVGGAQTDGCGRTDGIAATAEPLGAAFPNGLFVCQDNSNTVPAAGLQNFKFVPLQRVVEV